MKKFIQNIGPFIGAALFIAALFVLHHALKKYNYHDIIRHVKHLPPENLALAVVLTILSYLVLTGYDTFSVRYFRHPINYFKSAFASFIGYAFSHNIGVAIISGGGVRYRLYSSWGLSALDIAKIIVFNGITFWSGFCALGAVVFLSSPLPLPPSLHIPLKGAAPLGIVCLSAVLGYMMLCTFRRRPFSVMGIEFPVPPLPLGLLQIVISSLDWTIAGSVVYVLVTATVAIDFRLFLGIFLFAQIAGLISQVPGGLGVFEMVMLVMLAPFGPPSDILGALLAYRGIYFLMPLIAAILLLGAEEIVSRKGVLQRAIAAVGKTLPTLVPDVLSIATFIGGTILLFSGAAPPAHGRLALLGGLVPLPVMEISHFLASVAGLGLLVIARGLQRRLDAAYIVSAVLLMAGIIFSLMKGLDYVEALVLSIMLFALLPSRQYFYRKAALTSQPFTAGWSVAIFAVIASSVWLGIFSYKHVPYSYELWWRFSLHAGAPRFLRATVGVLAATLAFGIYQLLRPTRPKPAPAGEGELRLVQDIISASGHSWANLALLGDKRLLFNEAKNAFIMYGIEGRSWVSMGGPIGPPKERAELGWAFRELADRHGGWSVFYEAGLEDVQVYIDMGLGLMKLGEEARVQLHDFSMEGHSKSGLRDTVHRLDAEGYSFKVVHQSDVPALMPELRAISDAWLAAKDVKERGFSMGFFSEDYIRNFSIGMALRDGRPEAFSNIWLGQDKEEVSPDLMRHMPEAANGLMDYLFIRLMLWAKEEGYRWFNLGMAPLAGLEAGVPSPLFFRLGSLVFRHGEHFYNFQGLRNFKEKFGPRWESRYLVSPGSLTIPRVMANIIALTSKGPAGVIVKR
ncbi:MAG: bifunctional lysylphosphatidylglycerol flippase/synthetase MprF [Nitrospirota bacterium]